MRLVEDRRDHWIRSRCSTRGWRGRAAHWIRIRVEGDDLLTDVQGVATDGHPRLVHEAQLGHRLRPEARPYELLGESRPQLFVSGQAHQILDGLQSLAQTVGFAHPFGEPEKCSSRLGKKPGGRVQPRESPVDFVAVWSDSQNLVAERYSRGMKPVGRIPVGSLFIILDGTRRIALSEIEVTNPVVDTDVRTRSTLLFETDRALVQFDGSSPIGPLFGPARLVLELVVPGHPRPSLSLRGGSHLEPGTVCRSRNA
jgi:hypothetical protein